MSSKRKRIPASMRRQIGKSAAFVAMYAMYGGTAIGRWSGAGRQTHLNIMDTFKKPTHPLDSIGLFDHKGRDNRFGNIHTYKCDTKTFSSLMANAEFVPHTNVRFVPHIVSQGTARVCSVLWVRRHKIRELEDAVATLIMLGHEHIVAVRSFDPP